MDSLDLNDVDSSVVTSHLSVFTGRTYLDTTNEDSNKCHKCITDSALEDQIRSSAIVQYSASKYPTLFTQLAPQTNINLAPSNWLRRAAGLRPNVLVSGSNSQSSAIDMTRKVKFSSLCMANSHIEMIGNVDVVSDAENIKKLLKVPYSKAHISMAVHRVGRTLLLEQFNVTKDLDQEQDWFRFVCSMLPQDLKNIKKKLPSAQLDRLMLSKFLYYSLTKENGEENSRTISAESSKYIPGYSTNIARLDDLSGNSEIHVRKPENRWDFWTPTDFSTKKSHDVKDKFERTILWTFEDLQMLLGTNMPIFGGGEYPAVSLRLFDSKKAINILTGIDYWLDNLICNVPEVVMCFHVNGIVQNYEVIKTEEIPKLENSKFNPQVIKDIAQSILSFLKSNCTKEGHTYWLFKGSNDDVVKLYDLTMLCDNNKTCSDETCSDLSNPFTIPVASLLFKMATNLMQGDGFSEHNITVKRLLKNCVGLLDKKIDVEPIMLSSALGMLSTLFLFNSDSSPLPYIGKDSLLPKDRLSKQKDAPNECHINEENSLLCENETSALTFCLSGLRVFQHCTKKLEQMSAQMCGEIMTVQLQIVSNMIVAYFQQAYRAFSNEQHEVSIRCFMMTLLCYEYWKQLNEQCKYSNETSPTKMFMLGHKPHCYLDEIFANTLIMCGDLKLNILQNKNPQRVWNSPNLTNEDLEIKQILKENFAGVGEKYKDVTRISDDVEQTLASCRSCYQTAYTHLTSYKPMKTAYDKAGTKVNELDGLEDKHTSKIQNLGTKLGKKQEMSGQQLFLALVSRKLGHVANEQGALELSKAVALLQQGTTDEIFAKEKAVWELCFSQFETALSSFKSAKDDTNQALVLSNLGKLMRICAQSFAQANKYNFTFHEQHLYEKALDYYQKALTSQRKVKEIKQTLNIDNCETLVPSVRDNISWELSSTYFSMAKRIQDNAPIGLKTPDEIERQIVDLMNKSLKHCSDIWKKTQKTDLTVLRCGEIHARLASLHHNSFQKSVLETDFGKRRHLKALGENHYNKACTFYLQVLNKHPTALLRVEIERVALQEQFITSISSTSRKLKAISDGFKYLLPCVKPLNIIIQTLKETVLCSKVNDDSNFKTAQTWQKSSVPKNNLQKPGPECMEEWCKLSGILNQITLSLLLYFLKAMQAPVNSLSAKKPHISPQRTNIYTSCKDIYARTLRCNAIIINGNMNELLLKKMDNIQEIIQDLEKQNICQFCV